MPGRPSLAGHHHSVWMNLLPLVQRELRVAIRRPGSYRLRLAAAYGSMGLTVWTILVASGWTSAAQLGRVLLAGSTGITFAALGLAGLFLTSDSVSRERREGTLGLLFLTDLQSADVIFGKFVAKAIVPLYAVIAAFPALVMCVLFGGVTAGEFWRFFLVLGNTLFFSLAICLAGSTLCEKQRFAHLIGFLVTVVAFGGLPAAGYGASSLSKNPLWYDLASLFSPTGSYSWAFDVSYRANPRLFWASLVVAHLMAWLGLGFACRALPRAWQSLLIRDVQPRTDPDIPRPQLGSAKRMAVRSNLLSSLPVAWLASKSRPSRLQLWMLPLLALLLTWFKPDPFGVSASQTAFGALMSVHALLKIWLAAETSYAFAKDRQNGTLELLLGTPLEIAGIGKSMLRALRNQFGPPLLFIALIDLVLAGFMASSGNTRSAAWLFAGAITLLFDAYCVCWIGLWRGLASQSPALAAISTIGTSMALPWIWFSVGAAVFANSSMPELAGLWLVVSTLNNAVFLIKARDGFLQYFRVLALRPFGSRGPRIESKWSPINWDQEEQECPLEGPASTGRKLSSP